MKGNALGNVKRQLYFALFLFMGCIVGIGAVQATPNASATSHHEPQG